METIDGHPGFISGSSYVGEGLPINTFYLKKFAGVDPQTGLSQWYMDKTDASGKTLRDVTTTYSEASYYLCGDPIPDLYGGFGTSLSIGGFDMAMAFTYQIGGLAYDSGYATFMASPVYTSLGMNFHKDVLKAWTPEHPDTDVPRLDGDTSVGQTAVDNYLISSNFLSVNNITIGYSLPATVTSRMKISGLRIYVAGDNLAVVSARRGVDPRYSMGLGSFTSGSGLNSGSYSAMRTVTGGITLTF